MINSTLSKMASSMAYLSALTMVNEDIYNTKTVFHRPSPIVPAEEWKRKLCKTCKSCGSFCSGKWSKPMHKACKNYNKKL